MLIKIGRFDNYFYNSNNGPKSNIDIINKMQNKNQIKDNNDNILLSTKNLKSQFNKKLMIYNLKKVPNKPINIKKEINKQKENKNKNMKNVFDLRNSKFESKTINRIIKEFYESENNYNNCNKKNEYNIINKNTILKPKTMEKIINNDYKIYLQYGQNNEVEKIILNDKYGRKTSFIPTITPDK